MSESPESIVRAYFAAFGKSVEDDHKAYLQFLDDKVEYYSGTRLVIGNAATVEFSKQGAIALGLVSWRAEILHLAAEGDNVLYERLDYQINAEGEEPLVTTISGVIKVKNGKIVQWRDYWDAKELIEYGIAYRKRKGLPPIEWKTDPQTVYRVAKAAGSNLARPGA